MQGIFPEGVIKVSEPLAKIQESPPLYGVASNCKKPYLEEQ